MKGRMLLFALAISASSVNAQKKAPAKIPAAVKAAFAKAHPGISATWEKEDGHYEAVYKVSGKEASCVITGKGSILETETAIAMDQLPAAASAYVKQRYKGAKITETARIEKASGEVVYEVVVAGKDILFDKDGKLLKIVKD
jgi:predicted RNA polymerase sigma factor